MDIIVIMIIVVLIPSFAVFLVVVVDTSNFVICRLLR